MLVSLGGSVGASPTIHAGGSQGYGVGQAGRDAIGAIQSYQQAKAAPGIAAQQASLAQAAIKRDLAAANRDETQAQLNLSNVARIQGAAGSNQDGLGITDDAAGTYDLVAPRVPTTQSTGVESGIGPAESKVRKADGRYITVYHEKLQPDEINQVRVIYQEAVHAGTDAMVAINNWFAKHGKWITYPGQKRRKHIRK